MCIFLCKIAVDAEHFQSVACRNRDGMEGTSDAVSAMVHSRGTSWEPNPLVHYRA